MYTHAVEIVRLQIDYSGSLHTLDIELHDDIAPLTVARHQMIALGCPKSVAALGLSLEVLCLS